MSIELVAQVAPVISALAASFSAMVALRAARVNKTAQDDLRTNRQLAIKSELYRHQVAEPLRAYVREFSEQTSQLLAAGFASSDSDPAAITLTQAQERARTLISQVKERWRAASKIMMAGAEAWWDLRLLEELDAAREEVADSITKLIDRRLLAGEREIGTLEFETVIHQHTVSVLRILLDYEPALSASEPRGPRRMLTPPTTIRAIAPPSSSTPQRRDPR
jgi:hypothetical protein